MLLILGLLGLGVVHAFKACGVEVGDDPKKEVFHCVDRFSADTSGNVVVSPTLIDDGGFVTVNFTCSAPKVTDVIAGFTPGGQNVTNQAPAVYKLAVEDEDYLSTGKGSLVFGLVSSRTSYSFGLMDGTSLVAMSGENVTFRNALSPVRPRVALTDTSGELRITWTSGRDGSSHPGVRVKIGSSVLHPKVSTATYSPGDLCGSPATDLGYVSPGFIHTAVVSGLNGGEKVEYTIFDDEDEQGSSFEAVMPPLGGDDALEVFVFGDMGAEPLADATDQNYMPASLNTSTSMGLDLADGFGDLVLHVGDISYARGFAAHWDLFLHQTTGISSKIPWMLNQGNHERDFPRSGSLFNGTDSGGECGVPTSRLLPMPGMCYAFESGLVRFVMFSTELDFSTGSEQFQCIESLLQATDRSRTPWLIAGFHRPMLIDSTNNDAPAGDQPVAAQLRKYVEPLFVKYKVDVAFQGHHHSYQRQCASIDEKCIQHTKLIDNVPTFVSPSAPVHLVIGTAGAGYSTNTEPTQPEYTEKVLFDHGYARLRVFNASLLEWQFITGNTATNIADHVRLQK